jgi:NAD(P)-dependent dehydrogenase (short-subunit alcohol dehydrogenase family)
MYSLGGRTAVVTGASRGIGEATARALDAAGARVVLVARGAEAMAAIAATLANDPVVVAADLAAPDGGTALAQRIVEAVGGVDILVNNAATATRIDSTDLTADIIDNMFAVNVRNLLLLTTGLIPSMIERGGGSIVNLSSVSGLIGTPRRSAYAGTKGAVDAMTRSLAMEYGPKGIRVNCVAPGVIDTELWAKNKAIPGVVEEINALIPLRRWGVSEEVADVILFLASDAARYVTAQTIGVDGGQGRTQDMYGGAV